MNDREKRTRADLVRQRRWEQMRRQQEQPPAPPPRKPREPRPPMKKKPAVRELPPLTARGVVNDFAIQRRKKVSRRRFHAALTLPRPALRPLALPRPHLRAGWRLLSFTLVVVFGVALYLLWSMPQFRVSAAQVTGNQRLTADEIDAVLGLAGHPIFLLAPAQIEAQALRNYPELASVTASISLPNIVAVQVAERQPVILWQQDGSYTWIDATGVAFRPRGEAAGLVVVQALAAPPAPPAPEPGSLAPPAFISAETVEAILTLAPFVPPGTPILYDPLAGLGWNDGRGWQAVFGSSAGDMPLKARVYQALVDSLSGRGIRPVLVNVAHPNAPFYRLEQAEVQDEAAESEVEEQ
ncbi:MAG: cell division protein FtsQ/DivIB [Chloroflexota bacterium]